jgi:hypothetical protein
MLESRLKIQLFQTHLMNKITAIAAVPKPIKAATPPINAGRQPLLFSWLLIPMAMPPTIQAPHAQSNHPHHGRSDGLIGI